MDLETGLSQDLIEGESFRAVVYNDATGAPLKLAEGHPTIGYGRALDVKGITEAEAYELLLHDVREAILNCAKYPWWCGLSYNRQRVIANMVFQLGETGFGKFKKLEACLNTPNYTAASAAMLDSEWAIQVPSRAQKLAAIMEQG